MGKILHYRVGLAIMKLTIFLASPERQELGSYLLRRSPDNHFTYFLHYVIDSTSSGVGELPI